MIRKKIKITRTEVLRKPNKVKTGDDTGIFSLIIVGGVAFAIAVGCIISKKMKK